MTRILSLLIGLLLATSVMAQSVVVTGTVQMGAPNGRVDVPSAITIFNQNCNGGAGGIVGQATNGVMCGQSITPSHSDGTIYSGSIVTANTWQQVVPNNAGRIRLLIQNYCTASSEGIASTESLFFASTPATPPAGLEGIELAPCGSYDSDLSVISTTPIWIMAATAGHKYLVVDWVATGLAIIGTPSPTATVGAAYSFVPTASGGATPYAFSSTGTLPPGLSFNTSTGAITGTPLTAGAYTGIVITVQDNAGVEQSLPPFSITVSN
jgi:hypothetical protein